jgi:hypothetical protein
MSIAATIVIYLLQINRKKPSQKLTLVNIYRDMSFQKINLPDVLLADLYKEGLVVIDKEPAIGKKSRKKENPEDETEAMPVNETASKISEVETERLSWLGSNQKHISIIVKDDQAIHLQDDLLDILSAILGACKLNLADVAIINMHNHQVSEARLKSELNPSAVLLFGVETSQIELPFKIPDYKIQPFNNCSYLQAAALEKMKGNSTEAKVEKSKLWVCLKTLFGV